MNSPRADFVNHVNPSDNQIDPTIGCATVFVYYLFTQLGCPITLMTSSGAQQLSGVYANITGDQSDPFPYFKNLVDLGYPGTARNHGTEPGQSLADRERVVRRRQEHVRRRRIQGHHQFAGRTGFRRFTLWIQGLSKAAFANLNIQVAAFTGTFASLPGVIIQPNPLRAQFQSGVSQYAPQRIQIPFDIVLSAPFLNQFPSSGSTPFGLSVSLTAGGNTVTASQASTQIELVAGADPYFSNMNSSNSNLPYLSEDLRVFMVTPGLNATPIPNVAALADSVSGAYTYIQNVLKHFNDPLAGFTNPAGPDPFATVLPNQDGFDPADSSVFPWTFNLLPFQILNNYSFAIAHVRCGARRASRARRPTSACSSASSARRATTPTTSPTPPTPFRRTRQANPVHQTSAPAIRPSRSSPRTISPARPTTRPPASTTRPS